MSHDPTFELQLHRFARRKGPWRRLRLYRAIEFARSAGQSGLSARFSQINGCAYCIDMHSRDLLKGGLAAEKLVLVPAWREAGSLFDSRARTALAVAGTVSRVADTAIPDSEFESASAAFSAKELADLTIA